MKGFSGDYILNFSTFSLNNHVVTSGYQCRPTMFPTYSPTVHHPTYKPSTHYPTYKPSTHNPTYKSTITPTSLTLVNPAGGGGGGGANDVDIVCSLLFDWQLEQKSCSATSSSFSTYELALPIALLDSKQHVTKLNLHNKKIPEGTISTLIGLLTYLTKLDLSHNAFQGTIPTELGQLATLKQLYLNNNQLTGKVPTELNQLTNLDSSLVIVGGGLDISSNKLTPCLPQPLVKYTSIFQCDAGMICPASAPAPSPSSDASLGAGVLAAAILIPLLCCCMLIGGAIYVLFIRKTPEVKVGVVYRDDTTPKQIQVGRNEAPY